MIYSLDISGVQDFIYTITSKNALKSLRSRSFYLEIMLEHLVDEILDYVGLSRVNMIYSGGGHAYLILPNTNRTIEKIEKVEEDINNWFLEMFGISLFIAGGYCTSSANDLKNEPRGSYKAIFSEVSKSISNKKLRRYNATDIIKLNKDNIPDGERECSVCKRSDLLSEGSEKLCQVCESLIRFSASIIDEGKDFFSIVKERPNSNSLPLPNNKYLLAENKQELKKRMQNDPSYIRSYGKNNMYTGFHVTTKLWVGDYSKGNTFKDLAKASTGIERLGVLRADVDNLGQAFVSGFESEESGDKYVTLSRTATFSRKLSMFFKLHINEILENGQYYLSEDIKKGKRNATIVYSGGDDIFIIGSWDDIVGFAIDLYKSLKKYSQDTLTISAGIGLYHSNFPISVMAQQVAQLEECSKEMPNKNAITLFSEDNCYTWDVLINKVLGEKFKLVKDFFDYTEDRGKNLLYNILDLLRNKGKKINLARYAYLLARLEPDQKAEEEQKEVYKRFRKSMYEWMQDNEDCRELITAIYIYVYLERDKEEEKDAKVG